MSARVECNGTQELVEENDVNHTVVAEDLSDVLQGVTPLLNECVRRHRGFVDRVKPPEVGSVCHLEWARLGFVGISRISW